MRLNQDQFPVQRLVRSVLVLVSSYMSTPHRCRKFRNFHSDQLVKQPCVRFSVSVNKQEQKQLALVHSVLVGSGSGFICAYFMPPCS